MVDSNSPQISEELLRWLHRFGWIELSKLPRACSGNCVELLLSQWSLEIISDWIRLGSCYQFIKERQHGDIPPKVKISGVAERSLMLMR
jgi:hypothetical protein